jgi:glycolate oxidase FAD binding subunit
MASDLIPCAVEIVDAETGRGLGLRAGERSRAWLVAGFDGIAEPVDWQCTELARLVGPLGGGPVEDAPAGTWPRLAMAPRGGPEVAAAVMRLVVLPAAVAEVMEQGADGARQRGLASAWAAHAGVGVVRAALFSVGARQDVTPIAAALRDWRALARAAGGHATLESAPLAVKAEVPVWDDPGAAGRIMQRIKAQLDPGNLLNPGRFVAGI